MDQVHFEHDTDQVQLVGWAKKSSLLLLFSLLHLVFKDRKNLKLNLKKIKPYVLNANFFSESVFSEISVRKRIYPAELSIQHLALSKTDKENKQKQHI